MIDCKKAAANLYDYLDGELTPNKVHEILEHLKKCQPCFCHSEFEKALKAVIRKAGQEDHASRELRHQVDVLLYQKSSGEK